MLCSAAAAAGDWNGAGGHVNYSNNATRAAGTGWDAIQAQIAKLEKRHAFHIAQYGEVRRSFVKLFPVHVNLVLGLSVSMPGISRSALQRGEELSCVGNHK